MWKIIKIIICFFVTFNMLSCNQNGKANQAGKYNKESFQNKNITKKEKNIEKVKINIEIGNTKLTALLENNETTKNLFKLLPMTVKMKELYESEKYVKLPVELSKSGVSSQGYEIGDIGYWAPGNCLVIYYKQTGEIINGLQIIGEINENIEVFEKHKGTVTVKISKAD